MRVSAKIADFWWFGVGYAVFGTETDDRDFYPSLDDDEALRHWLAGISARLGGVSDDAAIESILNGDCLGGELVEESWRVRILGD